MTFPRNVVGDPRRLRFWDGRCGVAAGGFMLWVSGLQPVRVRVWFGLFGGSGAVL